MTMPDTPLGTAILCFNLLPSSYIHPSWRAQYFPNEIIETLFSTEQVKHHLSLHILKARQLEDTGYFDEAWPYWSLALASSDQLARYAQTFGGLLLRHVLQHSIQRDTVMRYRQSLGHLYAFILEKGPLLYPKPLNNISIDEDFLSASQKLGWIGIIKATSLFPAPVRERFLLKLPYDITLIKDKITLSAKQALNLLSRISYEMRAQ